MNNMNRGYYFFTPSNMVNAFRKLWEQHGLWTRSFIVSTAADLPDLEYVTARLLRNPSDFVFVLEPFYGEAAGSFEQLLREHLLIAANLLNHAKNNDAEGYNEARIAWYSNADEIAALLASLNPYWSYSQWRNMLHHHLRLVEEEATLRLLGKYKEDVELYDTIEEQALEMADTMSGGIIRQFRLDMNPMR
ncbi:MAG: acetylglutamate kinase [Sedimentibacter sp.]|uniref:acetylglutamate kinase n=1 Tax=Sedimentibacter sp. TaxID=1960295 RepID=UPI003158966A